MTGWQFATKGPTSHLAIESRAELSQGKQSVSVSPRSQRDVFRENAELGVRRGAFSPSRGFWFPQLESDTEAPTS